MKNYLSLILAIVTLTGSALAQGQTSQTFSLQESINYALQNRASLQVNRNEEKIAKAQVGEIRSMGLPQVNGILDVGNNFVQQQQFLPGEFFNDPNDPESPQPGSFVPVTFTPAYTGNAVLTGSQLLFDGTYLIGLKAAKTYTELSKKSTRQSEIEVAEQVSKAYYGVLVNRERMELLNQNITRLDTVLNQTRIMFDNGVAEKLDVDRLRVSLNNLKVEKQKAQRLMDLSESLLKFQMGIDQKQPIVLTDKLAEVEVSVAAVTPQDFDYSRRVEYSILETQRDLAELDLRNRRSGYLPKLYLNARYGYNAANNEFQQITKTRNWLEYGYVGGQIQLPIFDGLRKHYQIQQARIALDNTKYGFETLRQSIDLQIDQSATELTNALDVLDSQRENLELAEDIARVAKIKFQEGVGSNLEVITAETDLRQAQTNYYAAIYDALIAKVNLEKATGTLLTK
ncbi:outer membrane protein TolC [Pontibacter aydingkolensis]|uniref:TolC family protein n=1 Tax=Pontibacter aydingkolensis TaxID=1911536 RepID=A0ABS7CQC6_9BACT|nr:TolC family protein [Pontibacter aydingkolensis]MBW7465983.1 TolC family protein [Pontibacter aydingkolensis]